MPIDYKLYPANWKTEIRPAILKRANNRCEFCGLENGRTVYAVYYMRQRGKKIATWYKDPTLIDCDGPYHPVRVVLTIAHLDHDERNHAVSYERLAALCQLCHLRYDAEEKARRKAAAKGGE